MQTRLLIKNQDDKLTMTVISEKNDWEPLFSKTCGKDVLESEKLLNYIKLEFAPIYAFSVVDTSHTILKSVTVSQRLNADKLKSEISNHYTNHDVSFFKSTATNQGTKMIYELTLIEDIELVQSICKRVNINFRNNVSYIDSVRKNLSEGISSTIDIEDNYSTMIITREATIIDVLRQSKGLVDSYNMIKNTMQISTIASKKIFSKYGSIPPTSVTDNKIIYSNYQQNVLIPFTKVDLSKIITSSINKIYSGFYKLFIRYNKYLDKINLIGKATTLRGYKSYIRTTLQLSNVDYLEVNKLGLDYTQVLDQGALDYSFEIVNENVEIKTKTWFGRIA